ncbi:MAG: hypothetical protein ACYCTL_13330 [Acidimicrobiales bacterium]
MGRIAVIGESPRIDAFALAGADLLRADSGAESRAAWDGLPEDVEVVLLTPAAATAIGEQVGSRPGVIAVTLPS